MKLAAAGYKSAIEALRALPSANAKRPRTLRERLIWLDEEKKQIERDICAPEHDRIVAELLEDVMAELGLG